MELFKGLKKAFSTSKSSVYSVNNLDFEKMKNFFSWGNDKKSIKNYLNSYVKNPLVYMVVNKISQTTASMPRIVVDDKGVEVDGSDIDKIISNPNAEQSQIEFNEEVNESMLLSGNAYIYFEKEESDLINDRMFVLKPDHITPKFSKLGVLLYWEYIDEFGRIKVYDVDNVLHIKTSNIVKDDNNYYSTGLSPLEAGWIIVQSSDQKFEAEASIFKNRGIIGVLSSNSDTPMLPAERKRLQDEYDEEMGGASKFNKVKISSTKLSYMQTGMSPTDLKLLEGIISSLRLICGLYGMPSVLFNDTANSTFNNYTTAVGVSYSDVYIPLANKIDAKLSTFLSDKYNVEEYIIVDSSKVDGIKSSTNEVAQLLGGLSPLLANKIVEAMTQNEVRDVVNLRAIDGGDELPTQSNASNPGVNVNL
jgi:HK97 family phage portal protein